MRKPIHNGLVRLMTASTMLAIFAFAPVLSHAGELDPSHIPARAKWIVHCDFDALGETQFAEKLRSEKPNVMQAIYAWFQQQYGIDPPEDLHSATMFSDDYRAYTGRVILQADYDPSKVEAKLRKQSSLETTKFNDHTLYTVTLAKHADHSGGRGYEHEGGKEMTVVLFDEGTIVLASSVANAKGAIRLLNGETTSLKEVDSELLTEMVDNAWMYGAAIELGEIEEHQIAMPVLQQHEKIVWAFGQRDGQLFEEATLTAKSSDVAKKMKQVLEGIVAYEQLWAHGSDPLRKVVDEVKVKRDGNEASFTWQGDSETVIAAVDDALARVTTWNWLWRGKNL